MSWNARPRSRAGSSASGEQRLEDRQHHLADHRGRAVHVDEQVVPGGVAVTVRSIAIERRKRWKHAGSMSKARTVCTTALSTGSSEAPGARSAKKRSPKSASAFSRSSTVGRSEVVDDVVGVAAERVERPHVVALHPRQHDVDQ